MSQTIAVIDFETTGMVPARGDRAIEVGIVLVEQDRVVDRFQSLLRTGVWISPFISELTGITNAMVAEAPDAQIVMREAARFVGQSPMLAHNAAFDSKFWRHELALVGEEAAHPFVCSVMLSRRLYPNAPSHKLTQIVSHLGLPPASRAHRALADAEMAAALLIQMQHDVSRRHGLGWPSHELLMQVQACPKPKIDGFFQRLSQTSAQLF